MKATDVSNIAYFSYTFFLLRHQAKVVPLLASFRLLPSWYTVSRLIAWNVSKRIAGVATYARRQRNDFITIALPSREKYCQCIRIFKCGPYMVRTPRWKKVDPWHIWMYAFHAHNHADRLRNQISDANWSYQGRRKKYLVPVKNTVGPEALLVYTQNTGPCPFW